MAAGQLEEKSADEVVTDESNKNSKADSDGNEEVMIRKAIMMIIVMMLKLM